MSLKHHTPPEPPPQPAGTVGSVTQGKATYMGGALPDTAAYGPYKRDKRPKIASEAVGGQTMHCVGIRNFFKF